MWDGSIFYDLKDVLFTHVYVLPPGKKYYNIQAITF